MPTTLSFTHTLPPQLTHYFSGDLGTLSLGIPYHTCNATKVARETTVFLFFFLFLFLFFFFKANVMPQRLLEKLLFFFFFFFFVFVFVFVLFCFFFFQSYGGYLTVGVPFWVLVNSLNGLWCSHTSIHSILYFIFN